MSMNDEMKKHAFAILEAAESWYWPEIVPSRTTSSSFKVITPKLLKCFISESVSLGGSLLGRFWEVLGMCNPLLKENISHLQQTVYVDIEHSVQLLFQGLNREAVDFEKIFGLATEIFTHLGVAKGRKSNYDTPITVSEEMTLTLDELLLRAEEPGLGIRKQKAFKELAYKRDGGQCLFTDQLFTRPPIKRSRAVHAQIAHIVPNLIHDKPDTLAILVLFAGPSAVEVVRSKLKTISNVMNLQFDANGAYDDMYWGIEAREDNGQITYIYRNIPSTELWCESLSHRYF